VKLSCAVVGFGTSKQNHGHSMDSKLTSYNRRPGDVQEGIKWLRNSEERPCRMVASDGNLNESEVQKGQRCTV